MASAIVKEKNDLCRMIYDKKFVAFKGQSFTCLVVFRKKKEKHKSFGWNCIWSEENVIKSKDKSF